MNFTLPNALPAFGRCLMKYGKLSSLYAAKSIFAGFTDLPAEFSIAIFLRFKNPGSLRIIGRYSLPAIDAGTCHVGLIKRLLTIIHHSHGKIRQVHKNMALLTFKIQPTLTFHVHDHTR